MGKVMAAARAAADPTDRIELYQNQLEQLAQVRTMYNNAAMASGAWHVQTVKNISASEDFTNKVRKQKLGIMELGRAYQDYRKNSSGALAEAIKEQVALRNATATQMTSSVFGKNATDLHLPKNLGPELDNTRVKLGLIAQAIGAASTQMVNWGKNTQWAGRQITVGLTMPVGMAAVGVAALALKVDEQLTRIQKVYDTTAQGGMAQERELAAVREQSLDTATRAAHEYGAAMKDTLDVQAQLAASGLSGADLHQATSEVVRIATLGEMEYQNAIDMTISLQTAFRLSNQELTESFNMMNAVENATSLSIQDIAEAVPRAASALSSLGGTVQDMTVMLTAMKEAGVDPGEGANALKSATTRLLNPTKAAITYFKQTFDIDLPKIVEDADGNIYDLMKSLAGLTQGFDNLSVQKGVSELFGTYQFNRITALWQNLGVAMTDGGNQTAKAMEVVGQSASDLAALADEEVARWQNSISGQFKMAVEGMKAELQPLGETVLAAVTPVIKGITALIGAFNDLPAFYKNFALIAIGAVAVVGPLLMLVGIFANLIGNIVKAGSVMANLRTRFRALSAEEAAAEIMARKANSAFDQEGAAASRLTMQIEALTRAMQENAVANGVMMDASGKVGQRNVVKPRHGEAYYGAGSVNAEGKRVDYMPITAADSAMYSEVNKKAEVAAETTEKTKRSWADIRKSAGNVAMVSLPLLVAMSTDFGGALGVAVDSMLMISAIASTGILNPVLAKARTLGTTIVDAFKGGQVTGAVNGFAGRVKSAVTAGGERTVLQSIVPGFKAAGSGLANIAKIAFRVFGPVGILAGGVFAIWKIVEGIRAADEESKALASSGQAWADALGYTNVEGKLPGMDDKDVDSAKKLVDITDQMRESSEHLAPALIKAKESGDIFSAAMGQALKVVTSGGTGADAREAFEASLMLAGVNKPKIEELLIQFDKVNLEDPAQIKEQLAEQLRGSFKNVTPDDLSISNPNDSIWSSVKGFFRNLGGGELSDAARKAGHDAGAALADGLEQATTDAEKIKLFGDLKDQVNNSFSDMYKDVMSNPDVAASADALGVKTADDLIHMMEKVRDKVKSDKELTGPEAAFWQAIAGDDEIINSEFANFRASYEEQMDTIIQGMVNSKTITQEQADEIREAVFSVKGLQGELGVGTSGVAVGIDSVGEATNAWQQYIKQAETSGRDLTEEQKLTYLNSLRAAAGLDAAKTSAQGMGVAAITAAHGVDEMANALAGVEITPEMRTQQLQSAMSGTMDDIYSEADRRLQVHQDAQVDAIRASGEAEQEALDNRAKAEDKYWDNRQEKMEDRHEAEERAFDKRWDAREKREEAIYDRRIDRIDNQIEGIEKAIDAEQKADDERQRIFEREKTRIERMSQMFSNNLDFNAALNTGDLDEAARVFNSNEAQTEQWAVDDQNDANGDASQQRQDAMSATIDRLKERQDSIKAEKDARMESLKAQREAESYAFKERQEEEKKLLQTRREAAREAIAAEKERARQVNASAQASAQAQFEADRRSLAGRIRALKAFVPTNEKEMRDHTAKIEALYREYGIDLKAQGSGWSEHIGTSLKQNVRTAARALKSEINWKAVGQVISDRMSGELGVDAKDLAYFLKNGKFPDPPQGARFGSADAAERWLGSRHTGGLTPGFSAKERTGVPRSASPFPSETVTLLKRGEYVVNEKATRDNLGLLEAINASRHQGGLATPMMMAAANYGTSLGLALDQGMRTAAYSQLIGARNTAGINMEALGGGGAFTGKAEGTSQTDRMFNTIRKYFPKVKLNDALRPGAADMHGQGKAIDIGLQGVPGGAGNAYMAAMNRWIHDNIPNVYELIYSGLGDDRPDLKRGKPLNYGPAIAASHTNHVHWAMESFHKGGLASMLPQLRAGGFTLSDGIANLHKGEAVLTKPLTDAFQQNVANSTNNGYNVKIEFNGPVNTEIDFERGVRKALDKAESKKGRSRRV